MKKRLFMALTMTLLLPALALAAPAIKIGVNAPLTGDIPKVGEGTMIDMGAILGGRATVGKDCHIGAGAVLAGVVEPANATPVIVEDGVLVGANAVVIEGVRVGKNAVVAAGSASTRRRLMSSGASLEPWNTFSPNSGRMASRWSKMSDCRSS